MEHVSKETHERLVAAMAAAVERSAGAAELNAVDKKKLERLTPLLIEAFMVSAVMNAEVNHLPPQVVLTCAIETLGGWNARINDLIFAEKSGCKN